MANTGFKNDKVYVMSKAKAVLWTLLVILISVPVFSQEKPNIVFIPADDFGYASLKSYGADKK